MTAPQPPYDPQPPHGGIVLEMPRDFRHRRLLLRWRTVLILIVLTLAMLTVAQEPVGWDFFAWFAIAPWTVAACGARRGGILALINLAAGLIFYLINLYWLTWVTPAGYAALALYLGAYFPLLGFIVRRLYLRKRWPLTFTLPLLWVAHELLRAWLWTGFPWFFLAHTQHQRLYLIQIADALGAYGVTFLVAMTNGLICDLLLRPVAKGRGAGTVRITAGFLILLTACTILATVIYGQFRMHQARDTLSQGPIVTVVQEVIPQSVKEAATTADPAHPSASTEEIFARHMVLSENALSAEPRPGLIVWPETMSIVPLNSEFLNLEKRHGDDFDFENFTRFQQATRFNDQIETLAAKGVALLIGSPYIDMQRSGSFLRPAGKRNSAILYDRTGQRTDKRYDKMHLVPFGEVVPFRESWPWLYRLLNSFTPYDYEYSLDPGKTPTVFTYTDLEGQTWNFVVAICYEDVIPAVPRRLVYQDGRKRADFLLNISNDGWFVRSDPESGQPKPSAELLQHLAICRFRAVENRIPIARAVNTGISAFIDPTGRLDDQPLAATLPHDPRDRQAVAGFLTDQLLLDSRTSPYAHVGDLFALLCSAAALILLFLAARPQRNPKRKLPAEGESR